ncbi:hypothetical protein GPJ56_003784 [Histomonas meleagridis]|uniref:uncharacterized protein n=1 Tax=Histomonas meleagridis TaxID=135588 RepID=UPI00355AB187|nr:hypothetical protein GPJ56_003784 [Histomonas meleagridis]KAH0805242.1 hypothetical protein GO595_002187 [Histomonas meleagridis]
MTRPQLRLDFVKNLPDSMNILLPNEENNEEKKNSPEYIKARDLFIDQIFSKDSLSKQIFDQTHWAVLLRDIPDVNGVKDINNYSWMVGHYQWDELVKKVVHLQELHSPTTPYGIYLVPTLGQSLYARAPERCELTYNSFISPVDIPPFTYLIQRKEANSNNDEEIYNKGAVCTFQTLESLHLQWDKLTTFTKEQFEFLQNPIDVKILKPKTGYQNSINKMSDEEFDDWFFTTMGGFIPLIPNPTTDDGKLIKIPPILVDPIECTPPRYSKLIELVDKINERMSTDHLGEKVRAIKGVVKYWQFVPNSISDELVIFANNGNNIPEKSKEFIQLFRGQYAGARDFIVEEILDGFLHVKRKDDEDFEMFMDAPIEIDKELEGWDKALGYKVMFGFDEEFKNFFFETMKEMKEEIMFWFNKDNIQKLYDEFKEQITRAMREMLETKGMQQYLSISTEQNQNEQRHQWLQMYDKYEVLYCLWPTIYRNNEGVLHEGEKDPILEKIEDEMLKNISKTSSLPEAKGHPIPPNN